VTNKERDMSTKDDEIETRTLPDEPEEQAEPKKPTKKASKKEKATTSKDDATALAEECLVGSWGTGRDRDLRLAAAGHDPDAVRKEVYRIRGERRTG